MNENIKKNIIGLRIMQRRKQLRIKQSVLAELIGVSDNQISNIENGKSFPRLNSFLKICQALQCDPNYLLAGTIQEEIQQNVVDLVASCSEEEQKAIWQLVDSYIHRNDDTRF